MDEISLYDDCVMLACNKEVRDNCLPFSCGVDDLDDFFINDADLYAEELLGKTYCWVTTEAPHRIVALFTLSNDSIKTKLMPSNDKKTLPTQHRQSQERTQLPGRVDWQIGG